MQQFCGAIHRTSFHESNAREPGVFCLVRSAVHQREDPCLFPGVIERMKPPDFIEATNGIQGVEKICVAGSELARLEVTTTQVCVAKRLWTLPREKMKTQPVAVGRRDALCSSKERDKQQKNQISVHLRLKLKVARKIFRRDLAHSTFELEGGVQRMIQFFNERDQRSDIAVPQPGARIMLFELVNQPPRIINADVKLVTGPPQKCARELAQFPGRCPCEHRQLRAPRPIDQTIFQVDSDLRVRAFE